MHVSARNFSALRAESLEHCSNVYEASGYFDLCFINNQVHLIATATIRAVILLNIVDYGVQ